MELLISFIEAVLVIQYIGFIVGLLLDEIKSKKSFLSWLIPGYLIFGFFKLMYDKWKSFDGD